MIITLGEYIDAIEKNGWKQAFGHLWISEDNKPYFPTSAKDERIYAACAHGQATLNLNIEDVVSMGKWNSPEFKVWSNFENRVVYLNDNQRMPLKKIAKTLREEFKDSLGMKLRGRKLNAKI